MTSGLEIIIGQGGESNFHVSITSAFGFSGPKIQLHFRLFIYKIPEIIWMLPTLLICQDFMQKYFSDMDVQDE